MNKMNTIKQDFRKLLDNNSDKDWNDLTFRQTMADAFGFNVNKRVELLKETIKNNQIDEIYINEELSLFECINKSFPEDKK